MYLESGIKELAEQKVPNAMVLTGIMRDGEDCSVIVCQRFLALCHWASSGWRSDDGRAALHSNCARSLGSQLAPRSSPPKALGWASRACGVDSGVDIGQSGRKGVQGSCCPPEEGLQKTTSLCIGALCHRWSVQWRLELSGSHTRQSLCDARLARWVWGEIWPRCDDAQLTFGGQIPEGDQPWVSMLVRTSGVSQD